MKMTLTEVSIRNKRLAELANKTLPSKLGYAIAKNLINLQAELNIIDKGRIAILDRYAERDAEGNPIIESGSYKLGENLPKFSEEYNEYLETETDVEIMMVPSDVLEKLDDPRYDALTGAQLISIDFMIE